MSESSNLRLQSIGQIGFTIDILRAEDRKDKTNQLRVETLDLGWSKSGKARAAGSDAFLDGGRRSVSSFKVANFPIPCLLLSIRHP